MAALGIVVGIIVAAVGIAVGLVAGLGGTVIGLFGATTGLLLHFLPILLLIVGVVWLTKGLNPTKR